MLSLILFLCCAGPVAGQVPPAVPQPPIVLTRPKEGDLFPSGAKGVIVAGKASDNRQSVWINNQEVSVFRTGSFMAYISISSADGENFQIAAATAPGLAPTAARTIRLDKPAPKDAKKQILSSLEPKAAVTEILPGETLIISFQAAAGGRASYKITSLSAKSSMQETRPGLYEARFLAAPRAFKAVRRGELLVYFKDSMGASLKLKTKRKIHTSKAGAWPKTLRVTVSPAKILADARAGSYWFSLPAATILTADAAKGNFYRLRLAGAVSGWIDSREVTEEKFFSQPAVIDSIEVRESTETAPPETVLQVGWPGNSRLPFLIEEEDARHLRLRIFNSRIHLNWIPYKSGGQASAIESVTWNIPQQDEVDINLELSKPLWWGYWADAKAGGIALRLRRGRCPPAPSESAAPAARPPAPHSPAGLRRRGERGKRAGARVKPTLSLPPRNLEGLNILLDPGHGGAKDLGALAPSGTPEQQMNLRLSLGVKKRLEEMGAKVSLTRAAEDQGVGLDGRVTMARETGADLFISIHCNDFSAWADPFKGGPWGSSVYYYHLGSLSLARTLAEFLNKRNDLLIPNNGVLWGDLYVARETTVPSILIESGYPIFPWQEELLGWDQDFAVKYAETIGQALENYTAAACRTAP
ncbi:MAG: N-acetylmuramoyl-L-alanine amidase [Elusimicrobia bacterium]|nr:N-acetylmuramoyl-L-alanine amidase [Elusimicrobiota bacterium]